MRRFSVFVIVLAMLLLGTATVWAGYGGKTRSNVYWWWGDHSGQSTLHRMEDGINARLHTTGFPEGQAMTMWIVVFNYPWLCDDGCGEDEVVSDSPAMVDVLYGDGNVVDASGKSHYSGHRAVGDLSGSINPLLGKDPIGLLNPGGAEIHYVMRTHGPANPAYMPAQILTYEGGCHVDFGTPTGPGDLHWGAGECQDIQFTVHLAP